MRIAALLIRSDKTQAMAKAKLSPIGEPAAQPAGRRRAKNPAYAAEAARLAPYEAVARLVVKHRLQHDLTQKELADLIGTSHSAISRLESGQATISLNTMKRIAEALGGRLLVGIELKNDSKSERELVAI
jgi:ribosome-binding protein aMBF1 (putative translation factor)